MAPSFAKFIRRFAWIVQAIVASAFLLGADAYGGGGPENTILVVNQNSPASLAVANLYIELRQIPPSNVVYLDLPFAADQEQITLAEFREKILKPIVEQIQARRLESQIDYIVYSADFPTAITINEAVAKLRKDQPDLAPEALKLFRPTASINALTYFAAAVLGNNNAYLSLDSNWYMRQPIDDALRSPFLGDEDRNYRSALVMIHTGKYEQALTFLEPLAKSNPWQFATRLELARCYAALGRASDTADAIRQLALAGWGHRSRITSMKEFAAVADDPAVKKAIDSIPDEAPAYLSSHGFRRTYLWGPNGGINSQADQGRNYFLSTVLAVTRNNGTSLAVALQSLRTSTAADFTHPQGDFYFVHNGDVRTKTRLPGFDAAIAGLSQLDLRGVVIKERVPANKKNVAGAILGEKAVPWLPSGSEIMPGAIVDNLTSFGGKMKGDHHTPATEFLKWGAAGSSGTVTEPFAIQAKFAHPMVLVHYARGCTLAEAYYQSVHGPFQLLIVGDPLCAPWANPIPLETIGLKPGDRVSGIVNLEIRSQDESEIGHFELFLNGVRSNITPEVGKFSFDADKIPGGFHELRVVAVAAGPLETRSRAIIPFWVEREGQTVELRLDHDQMPASGEVTATVDGPTSEPILIYQNSRLVGTIANSGESVRIAGTTLGAGKIQLYAVAAIDGKRVQSAPVAVVVQ